MVIEFDSLALAATLLPNYKKNAINIKYSAVLVNCS